MKILRSLLLLTICALAANAMAGPRKSIDDVKQLKKNETIIVGRVELVPPLQEHEQRLKGMMSKKFEDAMFFLTNEEYYVLEEEPGFGDGKGHIAAPFGEEFAVRSSREPFYFIAGLMYLELGYSSTPDIAYFPGGVRIDIQPDDKAIYIGTLRYFRNEFFEVTGVDIVDDFERANAEYQQKFGNAYPLRKALMQPVDQ